ncbi:unnamed protein product [Discula destructiva]
MALTTGLFSLLLAILECFVLLALQFCDQEPLASLYWSTWTVLQVGAVVAIFGIALHTRHMVKGRRHPPWALALGTPVLVVAGLGHYFQGKIRRGTRKIAASSRSRSRHSRGRSRRVKEEPLSEAPTVRGDSTDSADRARVETSDEDGPSTVCGDLSDKFNAKIVGYTTQGDIIIRIAPELTQEMSRSRRQSSIKWEEPSPQPPRSAPRKSFDKIKVEFSEVEFGTPRNDLSRHRSSSSMTFKRKEKEEFSPQQRRELDQKERSNTTDDVSSTEAPMAKTDPMPIKRERSPSRDDKEPW